MKKSLFFLFFTFVSLFSEEGIDWYDSFLDAKEIAVKEKKPLFLFFSGSDWCPWCKKLQKKILDKPAFYEPLKEKLIFAYVDFPMKVELEPEISEKNQELMKMYSIEGFPTIVLTDVDKGLITKIGYLPISPEEYSQYIDEILDEFYSLDDELKDPDSLSLGQWEKLATRAKILGSPYYNGKVKKAGMKSCPSPLFLLELYEESISKKGIDDKETKELKKKIVHLDPQDIYKSQYKIALLEFYAMGESKNTKPDEVIRPLLSYIDRFGAKNANLWKIHLMIAHYLFSKNLVKEALIHAKKSFKLAPEKIRKQLADTIASFKEKD